MDHARRGSRLGVRLTPDEKEIIGRAATLGGTSTADFVRTTVLAASERVVRFHQVLVLTGEEAAAFVEAITDPPEPNENLRALAEEAQEIPGQAHERDRELDSEASDVPERREQTDLEAGEITHRLRGSSRPEDGELADEEEYRRYLERRYG